jgi:hypothetical protein
MRTPLCLDIVLERIFDEVDSPSTEGPYNNPYNTIIKLQQTIYCCLFLGLASELISTIKVL